MSKINKFIFIIFFSCLAFSYNYVNILFLKKQISIGNTNNSLLKFDNTYTGPDDHNYVDPAINFIKGYGYTVDPQNEYLNVRRTPGYSIFYGIHYWILGYEMSFFWIRISQCLLFGLSVLLLRKTLDNLSFSGFTCNLSVFIYGFSPFVIGFLFNTITEAIHPEFVVIFLYFYSQTKVKSSYLNYFITGLFGAIIFLIRPTNIWATVIIGIFYLLETYKDRNQFRKLFFYLGGILILWSPWIIRNYYLKKEFIPLEKYYKAPMNYGVLQTAISDLWMGWGNPRPEELLNGISFDLNRKDKFNTIEKFVIDIPPYVSEVINVNNLRNTLYEVSDCYSEMIIKRGGLNVYKYGEKTFKCDLELKNKISKISDTLKLNSPIRYYLYAPILRAKVFIFHSFSSSYPYLNYKLNGQFNIYQKVLKGIMYVLNILFFVTIFFSIFYLNRNPNLLFFAIFPITIMITYVYLSHIEARYLISGYPFMAVLLAFMIDEILKKVKKC